MQKNNQQRECRIVVVGDKGVGKTSLCIALISRQPMLQQNVPPVLPSANIPYDIISREQVNTRIVDTSSGGLPADVRKLEEEVAKADSICIVYDLERPETFGRVRDYWLPFIRSQLRSKRSVPPIILMANKLDLRSNLKDERFEDQHAALLQKYHEIDCAIACSAKKFEGVKEGFYLAQKSFLYPCRPLFDKNEKKFKAPVINALSRIFRISDRDKDGYLNNDEIIQFFQKSLDVTLDAEKLAKTKQNIMKKTPQGITEKGMTLEGFLSLAHILTRNGSFENVWKILRKFGYGDDLNLRDDYLYPRMDITPSNASELSVKGHQFFRTLFENYDKDKDGALNQLELNEMFRDTPGIPKMFSKKPAVNSAGNMTLQGHIAQWSMVTFLDHKSTLAYLAYFGYEGRTPEAIHVTRGKREDKKRGEITKNTFLVYVFGSPGCGKSTFLNGLVGRQKEETVPSTNPGNRVVNSIGDNQKKEHYLILEEMTEQNDVNDEGKMDKADLFCLLYDTHNEDSFSYIERIEKIRAERYPTIPSVIVQFKTDLEAVPQKSDLPPEDLVAKHNLPLKEASKLNLEPELYRELIAEIYSKHHVSSIAWKIGIGVGVAGVVVLAGVAYFSFTRKK